MKKLLLGICAISLISTVHARIYFKNNTQYPDHMFYISWQGINTPFGVTEIPHKAQGGTANKVHMYDSLVESNFFTAADNSVYEVSMDKNAPVGSHQQIVVKAVSLTEK